MKFFIDDPWPPTNSNYCQSCHLSVQGAEKAVHTAEGVMHTHCAIKRFRELTESDSNVDPLTELVHTQPLYHTFKSAAPDLCESLEEGYALVVMRGKQNGKRSEFDYWKARV